MEKKVTISLTDFDELRNFKEEIEANHTVKTTFHWVENYDGHHVFGRIQPRTEFISTDDAVKAIGEQNDSLTQRVKELSDELWEYKNGQRAETQNGKTLSQVSNMSIWKFLKWRGKI
jgi:hypothetical protein